MVRVAGKPHVTPQARVIRIPDDFYTYLKFHEAREEHDGVMYRATYWTKHNTFTHEEVERSEPRLDAYVTDFAGHAACQTRGEQHWLNKLKSMIC